ncbi:hypothetical protein [Terracoccus sp. 273MFTsu3.1]|uniref:hypothetical protein n=1 Tax=Terracoccus sp. 273MFTsu3.1 TaxID=1172188 RepID=UPI0003667C64|nr:hypothetical protein [Terracoccus sp. 273MFTsu3.1]
MALREWGIWTENDGGFIEAQIYSTEQGEARLVEYFEEDPDNVGDLSLVEICPDHEQQPKDACEECAAEETDDDDEEEED